MKKKIGNIIWVFVLLLLVAWVFRWYQRKTVPPPMAFSNAILHLADGNKPFSLSEYRGKVLIVSCFQTWCRDCVRETPVLNELADKLPSDDFRVIYITDENNAKLAGFRKRLPSDKILFTISQKPLASFGIHVYPTTYLLDKKGKVVLTKLEGHNWLLEQALIKQLLDQ